MIKPFSTHRATEITSAPKVYGFDTGFICFSRGWAELRTEDKGHLWEHYVLNEIQSRTQNTLGIHYWRDKAGHEVDFILKRRGKPPIAVECKWASKGFNARALQAFRRHYPDGENWVVATDVDRPFKATASGLSMQFMGMPDLVTHLEKLANL